MSRSIIHLSKGGPPQRFARLVEATLRGEKPLLLLAGIVLVGVLLRLYVASWLAIDRDEGQFLYYGERSLQGALPLRDLIPEPDPLYIWMVAFMETIFGPHLSTIRFLSIGFSAIGILALHFLVKRLTNQRIATYAALVYAVSPTIILYNAIGNYRQVAWPIVIVSLYFLAVGMKEEKWKWLALFGATAGLAAVTYRIAAVFLVTAPVYAVLLYRQRLRVALRAVVSMIAGGLSTSFAVLGPIIYLSSFNWVNRVWGFGGGFGSYSGFGIDTFGPAAISSDRIATLIRIGFVDSREWYPILLVALVGAAFFVKCMQAKRKPLVFMFLAALATASFIVSIGPFLSPNPDFGAYPVWPPYDYASLVLFFLGAIGIAGILRESMPVASFDYARNIVFYWIISLAGAFSLFQYGHVFYFIAFAAPLSFLSGFGIQTVATLLHAQSTKLRSRQRILAIFLLLTVLASGTLATVSMYTTTIQERDLTQPQAIAISDYISSRTNLTDQILTGNLIFSVESHRNNELNMSQAYLYYQPVDNPLPGNPYGTNPTITQLVEYLATGRVVYVIMDTLLLQVMIDHPMLRDTVSVHFSLEITMYGIEIWRFRG
jgi:4-amino-4-deoxy-L-arabinose transferase-like glycosyltransferase